MLTRLRASLRLRLARCLVACAASQKRSLLLCSAEDTLRFGGRLASLAGAGDSILLCGDYGAGKTCLARGFIQRWFDDADELVTSPSYLIDNAYPDDGRALRPGVTVHHMDLWRLPEGKIEQLVDLPAVYSDCVSLIEWPERFAEGQAPREHLRLTLTIGEPGTRLESLELDDLEEQPRVATIEAIGPRWLERLPALLAEEDEGSAQGASAVE